MQNIYQRLDKVLPKIVDENFRANNSLGGEIGFHVFDYNPEHELLVRDRVKFIKDRAKSAHGLNIVEFDLYKIIIDTLSEFGYLEACFKMEENKGSEHVLFKAIKSCLRITEDDDMFIEYIEKRLEGADIVFLTGVGKAWPIIRSHTILNNLHRVVEKQPLVMFFPGTYNGGTLMLFNKLKDDNYYRAFELVDKY